MIEAHQKVLDNTYKSLKDAMSILYKYKLALSEPSTEIPS